MSLPTVIGTGVYESTDLFDDGSFYDPALVPIPSGGGAGNLLLIFLRSRVEIATPSGWTKISGRGNSSLFGKIAAADESSTVSFISTGNTGRLTANSYRIDDWEGTLADGVAAANADGNNPPNLDPGWGSQNILWLAGITGERADWTANNAPNNYSSLLIARHGSSQNLETRNVTISARRELNASSEQPGAFTLSNANGVNLHSFTIAILSGDFGLTFTTEPTVTSRTTDSYTIGGTTNQDCTVFAVATETTATDPDGPQIAAGTDGDDAAAPGTGSVAATAGTPFSFDITGTFTEATHDIHIVARKEAAE